MVSPVDHSIVGNTLRYLLSENSISIPVDDSYVTLYTKSGYGVLYGFTLDFDTDNIEVKLTIDNVVIFNLNCRVLEDFASSMTKLAPGLEWYASNNVFRFEPIDAMVYDKSVLIEARRSATNGNLSLQRSIVVLTEE